eukprot:410266-Rhodomonas_salina.1
MNSLHGCLGATPHCEMLMLGKQVPSPKLGGLRNGSWTVILLVVNSRKRYDSTKKSISDCCHLVLAAGVLGPLQRVAMRGLRPITGMRKSFNPGP